MIKLRYTAKGKGQAGTIRVGGQVYQYGQTYTVNNSTAERLLQRGGFEVVETKQRRSTRLMGA